MTDTPETRKNSGQTSAGTRTFSITLVLLVLLVIAYAAAHAITIQNARYLHTEGATVDAERLALLLGTAELKDELLTPPAIAAPAVQAVLDSLKKSVIAATTTDTVSSLFDDAVGTLVNLSLPEDDKQPSRDSATARITAFLSGAEKQAEALVAAPADGREVPGTLLTIELEQAKAAVLDYMAAPAVISRVNELKETARGLGYGPDSEVVTTLARIAAELEKDRPNRDLAAEMLKRTEQEVQGLRTSVFWSNTVLRWVEVIAWSLAGILAARLIAAGKFIGIGQYKPEWDRWWWAKVVLAPLMAVPVIAFLTYLTIDVQSAETLGIKLSLKDQPVEIVIAFSFIIGMFSDQAFKFLKNMADKILPTDDETVDRQRLIEVEDKKTPIKGRDVESVQKELEEKGFKVKVESKQSNEGQPGTVLGRRPTDKKLKKGSEITLVVVQA